MSVVYTCDACCCDFDSTYFWLKKIRKNINVFQIGSSSVDAVSIASCLRLLLLV